MYAEKLAGFAESWIGSKQNNGSSWRVTPDALQATGQSSTLCTSTEVHSPISSACRASALQAKGPGFESLIGHCA